MLGHEEYICKKKRWQFPLVSISMIRPKGAFGVLIMPDSWCLRQ